MKKCPNCGKMNLDKADVCKVCQGEIHDVVPGTFEIKNNTSQPENEKKDNSNMMVWIASILCIVAFIVVYYVEGWIAKVVISVLFAIPIVVCFSKLSAIDRANGHIPKSENIEYCPRCKSRNIKIYRKGYNYHKGFLLRIFDIKGGGYIAGMDTNNVCCRCMNCGKDWETDYDYRLIK